MNPFKRLSDIIDPGDGMLDESEYPEDMGRGETYGPGRAPSQFLNVYRTQLKLYSKDIATLCLYLFVIAIPVLALSDVLNGLVFDRYLQELGDTGETYAALCLGLLSLMMAMTASVVCGNILPNEFRSRTAYLNLPFPQSRGVFYFGKFAAGLTVVLSIVAAAYAMAIFVTSWKYDTMSSKAVLQSVTIALAGTFAFCATAYGLSAFLSKSSTMLPFIFIFMILPMVGLMMSGSGAVEEYIGYLPCFSGDIALRCLGSTYSVSTSYLFTSSATITSCNPMVAAAICVAWGVLFLLIGFNRIGRREM